MQQLTNKISQTVDDLASLLDQLYKFSHRQREDYYDRIQSCKNRLIQIKSNIRQSNLIHSEKIYQQIYLTVNMLKQQINNKLNNHIIGKSKTPTNRRFSFTNTNTPINTQNKSYQNTLQMLVGKEDQIVSLNKENTILKNNFELLQIKTNAIQQQLILTKASLEQILNDNRKLAKLSNQNHMEIDSLKNLLNKYESQLVAYKSNQRANVQLCQQAAKQINELSYMLEQAQNRINKLEKLNEINQIKMKSIEENCGHQVKQYQYKLQSLSIKEKELHRKIRALEDQLDTVNRKNQSIHKQQQQIRILRQDNRVLEKQLNNIQKITYDKSQQLSKHIQITDSLKKQLDHIKSMNEKYKFFLQEKQIYLKQSDQSLHNQAKKLSSLKEKYSKNQQDKQKIQQQRRQFEEQINILTNNINSYQENKVQYETLSIETKSTINKLNSQIISYEEQINSLLKSNKDLRNQLERVREKFVLMEEQKQLLLTEKIYFQTKNKDTLELKEKIENKQNINKKLELLIEELSRKNNKLQKQLQKTKCVFMRAKIETVRNIRQII